MDTYYFNVAGVSFRQDAVALLQVGDKLELKPEPTNKADPHAIAVIAAIATGDAVQIGYVPRDRCAVILDAIGAGCRLEASVHDASRPLGSPYVGVTVRLDVDFTG